MGHLAAMAGALSFVALALAPSGPLEAAEQSTSARLLNLQELSTPDQGAAAPVILRGSAVGPRLAQEAPSAAGWQVVAGRRLWLFDPATQDLLACRLRRTTLVGDREIRCVAGSATDFRRTFGPDFRP